MQRDSFEVRSFPSLDAFQSNGGATARVLIATEEIVGPVRNGGIASTYYHLARGLAAQGHDVTVLYLKGREVENETAEHWIDHYRDFSIDFVPLPDLDEPLAGASPRWQRRWLAFYRWLKANDRFDIVHSSEWRGGAFYCLQAKRLGLAFQDTLFVTKTSSPYIWNRHYQMQGIDNADLMIAAYAEQKCVEWADMVVGGSAHLLSFMDHIGYRLPEGRTFVQPNIVDFSEVKVEDQRPERAIGDTVMARELVFFGRLEVRKGLDLFVLALDALVARGVEIEKVTFLGKPGEPLLAQGGVQPVDFIEAHAEAWPFPIDIVTGLNQPEALSLMCSRDMIAAMPSLIENSTMAVYEALVHKIPFVATAVGGTPELIDPADHDMTLVPPDAEALADRLAEVLDNGQRLAKPAFDNDANLATWYGFHRFVAEKGAHFLTHVRAEPVEAPSLSSGTGQEKNDPSTSSGQTEVVLVGYASTPEALAEALEIVSSKMPGFARITLYAPFAVSDDLKAETARHDHIAVVERIGASLGACFNHALDESEAGVLVFDAAGTTRFAEGAARQLVKAATARPSDLVTPAFRFDADQNGSFDTIFAPLGGDPAAQALTGAAFGLELVAGMRAAFDAIGPFETYPLPRGIVHELTGRAIAQGRDLFVLPEPVAEHGCDFQAIADIAGSTGYLGAKALYDQADLPARKLLLHRPDAVRAPGSSGRVIIGRGHRPEGGIAWLTNVEKVGRIADAMPNRHHILLGFDEKVGRLDFAALHDGAVTVTANGKEVLRDPAFGARGAITASSFDLMPLFDDADQLRIRIELAGPNKARFASIIAQRIEDGVYFLSARDPIFWGDDFAEALALLGGERERPALPPLRRLPETEPSLMTRIRARMRNRR